jgi:hypothetical protein
MCKLPYKPIQNVCFQPWVGKNYKKRTPRLLVVGMSHYDWDGRNVPKYFVTNEVVQGRMSGEYTSQFCTNIVATCKGRIPNDEEKEQFWQSVAFYNYIQEFVGTSPRKKHAYVVGHFASSRLYAYRFFFGVVARLRPVLILAARVLPSRPPVHLLVYDVWANEEDHYGRSTCSGKEGSENKKAQSGRQEGSADSTVKGGWQKSSPDQKATSSGT